MKLTRKELVHAQDPQLAALGVTRTGHSGWLKKALASDFTPEQVRMFQSTRRKPKASATTSAGPVKVLDHGVVLRRFKDGESIGKLAEQLRTSRFDIEAAIRAALTPPNFAKDFAAAELVGLRELAAITPHDSIATPLLLGRIKEMEDHSAEEFANDLFRKHDGKLG